MLRSLNRSLALAIATILLLTGIAFSQSGTCSGMTVGQLTSLNGFVPFPSNNLWNTDISTAPVDPNSANYINFIGSTRFRVRHLSQPDSRYSLSGCGWHAGQSERNAECLRGRK
jgi:hypothetical protein